METLQFENPCFREMAIHGHQEMALCLNSDCQLDWLNLKVSRRLVKFSLAVAVMGSLQGSVMG